MNTYGFGDWSGLIKVTFIEHDKQRYETCGDWQLVEDSSALEINITDVGDPRMNFTLLMHELNEALVYLFKRNFSESAVKAVDEFDLRYSIDNEPGGDPLAPYYAEHMYAMECEHNVAAQLMLDWNRYTETLGALIWRPNREGD